MRNLVVILVISLALGGAGYYVSTKVANKPVKRAANVYDYTKDPDLVRTVNTALSLEAVMTRLVSADESGKRPDIKYGIDSISNLGNGRIKVNYRQFLSSSKGTRQISKSKIFFRKPNGKWAAKD